VVHALTLINGTGEVTVLINSKVCTIRRQFLQFAWITFRYVINNDDKCRCDVKCLSAETGLEHGHEQTLTLGKQSSGSSHFLNPLTALTNLETDHNETGCRSSILNRASAADCYVVPGCAMSVVVSPQYIRT